MKVTVIGAGPAGLASAVCAQKVGADVTILEKSENVGSSWRTHYDRLHLHTAKSRSALPYFPMPTHLGTYPSRADMVDYLDRYADTFDLSPQFGTTVNTVRPADSGWEITDTSGASHADAVIFATGLNGTPYRANLPGKTSFKGPILHSSDYRSGGDYQGLSVLVVGFGNSGGDISVDLAESGARVTLSVRGPVNILPHDLFGVPITSLGFLRKIMPYKWADAFTAPILRAKIGRPEDYGLQSAGKGPAAQIIEDGRVPLIDVGTLAAIKAGQITVKPGIAHVTESAAQFVDKTVADFDAVVLCTGYRTDLRAMLPESHHVLDPSGLPLVSGGDTGAKGLYFLSYRVSADGQLRQAGIEAMAIADAFMSGI